MTIKSKKTIELNLKIEKSALEFSTKGLEARLKRIGYTPEKRDTLDEQVVKAADMLIKKHSANINKAKEKIAKLEIELASVETK